MAVEIVLFSSRRKHASHSCGPAVLSFSLCISLHIATLLLADTRSLLTLDITIDADVCIEQIIAIDRDAAFEHIIIHASVEFRSKQFSEVCWTKSMWRLSTYRFSPDIFRVAFTWSA